MRFLNKINFINLCRFLIFLIFGLIIFYLTVNSLCITSVVNFLEVTIYKSDNPIKHLICFLLFIAMLILINKTKLSRVKINFNYIYIAVAAAALLFIAASGFMPRADQSFILDAANRLYKFNFQDLSSGGYLDIYPNQKGIVFILFLLQHIFGDYNYLLYQMINCLFFVIYFYCIVNISKLFYSENSSGILMLFLIAFFPVGMYVMFVYGNLIGLSLSLLSILFMLRFCVGDKKIADMILSAVFIALAVIFKQNYLISLIGMLCYLFLYVLKEKNVKGIVFMILIIAVNFFSGFYINKFYTDYTGIEKSNGSPSTAFIAMGLQEGNLAQGWYNSYNLNAYLENDCNSEKTDKAARENISESLKKFKEEPKYAIRFFSKKINSQWNNPTFQCFWIGEISVIESGQAVDSDICCGQAFL